MVDAVEVLKLLIELSPQYDITDFSSDRDGGQAGVAYGIHQIETTIYWTAGSPFLGVYRDGDDFTGSVEEVLVWVQEDSQKREVVKNRTRP